MAQIKINDLPLATSASFSDNDYFLILDNGEARLLSRPTFQAYMLANVQGEKGDTGAQGVAGQNGTNGVNGVNGQDGLSAYQIAIGNGFVGTESQWLTSLRGATGSSGTNGANGWSPVLAVASRGDDSVLQVTGWTGGTGTAPTTLGYISPTGIVTNINNASNIRGLQGVQGIQGIKGDTGTAGADGKTVQSIVFNSDLSVTVTYTDSSTVTSGTPPKQHGWGVYKDGQYSDISPLTIPTNTQVVLPNNKATATEYLPTSVATFYNNTTQKYLFADTAGLYSVKVKFKIAAGTQTDYINVSFNKGTTDLPYSEDRSVRGDSQIQNMNFSTTIHGDSALAANGLAINLKTYGRSMVCYDFEVTVSKLI